MLHSLGEAYGQRPSEIAGFESPWGAFQFDMAALAVGRQAAAKLDKGEEPFGPSTALRSAQGGKYRDPRGTKKIKTVKVKADGTW